MRTKKNIGRKKNKQSRYSKRRRTGGGWFGNLFKSKQQEEAERMREAQQEEAERMSETQQIEVERMRAERDIAMGENKNALKARWEEEYSEEGWETKEEIQQKIKKIPAGELENRISNQEKENDILHKKIDTLQNSLRTCYPDGANVIENTKLTELRNKLYNLKDQGQTLLTERQVLKDMFYSTDDCISQKKERFQDALTGDEPIVEPTNEESIQQANALTPPLEEITEEPTEAEEYVTVSPSSIIEPKTPRKILKEPPYTEDESNINKVCNTIKTYILELIKSDKCNIIYEDPDKFYETVKTRTLKSLITGNWLMQKSKTAAINVFLRTYSDIKVAIINTLKNTERARLFCESVSERSDTDVIKLVETFTDQLIVSIMNDLIETYNTNKTIKETIVWLQNTYYDYMEKRTIHKWEMDELERAELKSGGKHKRLIKRRKSLKGKKTCKGKKRVYKGKGKKTCKGKKKTYKAKKIMASV